MCHTANEQYDFTRSEWLEASRHRSGRGQGKCTACMRRNKPQAELRKCVGDCQQLRPREDFTATEWEEAAKHGAGRQQGRCHSCMARNKTHKVCSVCNEAKDASAYKSKKEFMPSDADRRCKTCSGIRRGRWTCNKCKDAQASDAVSQWLERGNPHATVDMHAATLAITRKRKRIAQLPMAHARRCRTCGFHVDRCSLCGLQRACPQRACVLSCCRGPERWKS